MKSFLSVPMKKIYLMKENPKTAFIICERFSVNENVCDISY